MDARTIRKLLQCVQTTEERVAMTHALDVFCAEHRTIGRRKGNWLYLLPSDRDTLRQILAAEGIDPTTSPDAWEGKTRAQALALGNDEKLAHDPVKRRRLAVKALAPSATVDIGSGPLHLPAFCHLDVDYNEIHVGTHDVIIVVENWECFDRIHMAARRLQFPGVSPLVVWRGDTSATRADAMLAWLSSIQQPVAAFVDYDPAGLVIAGSLPRLTHLVVPELDELARLLEKGLSERFRTQLPGCQRILDESTDRHIGPVWKLIRAKGKALPQEHFVS
ncbi:MAG: hypothetical protein A3H93_05810 [Rhodocyclales bacterium RIFCSPLOWO2_02_FULL_63_24]|nr:MAG: hypothetical protein A3H93_05810 [Rhodocyclales bacterium RIFCSPLOWO2_02_FULL_63_24]